MLTALGARLTEVLPEDFDRQIVTVCKLTLKQAAVSHTHNTRENCQ